MQKEDLDTFQQPTSDESSPSASPAATTTEERPTRSNHWLLGNLGRTPSKAEKRSRGEIACAECRRLKIRCDKMLPCSSCVKRGCSALCPNGTIPPGEGNRFVLAATEHLQQKLTKLESRMRALEDALAVTHGTCSDEPHPLLIRRHEDFVDDDRAKSPSDESARSSPGLSEHVRGNLVVDSQGNTSFFGPTGASESLLMMSHQIDLPPSPSLNGPVMKVLDPSYFPPAINLCYLSFPFRLHESQDVRPIQGSIESFLPALDRALFLCDKFAENLTWMFSIVSRQQLVNELIPAVYKRVPTSYGPHELGLLYTVLAMGCLVDLSLPPYDLEAQHYYRLARAALALQPVLEDASVMTVKALHLMSIYNGMSGQEENLQQSYALLDLASQVAAKIGLHTDPVPWGFQGLEVYERRLYFWNLMSGALWQSLVTGRPPSLLTSSIKCRIPSLEDETTFDRGQVPAGYGIWGCRATAECLMPLVTIVLSSKPRSYESILELDKRIRDFSTAHEQVQNPRVAVSQAIFSESHYQEYMLMFLHRAHFVRALLESPADPLNSAYSQSVHAAYASACVILQHTRDQYLRRPSLCSRVWRIWSFAFTAALVVGAVAIRRSQIDLRPPPLEELQSICKVFEGAASINIRAARVVPILHSMLQKAYTSDGSESLTSGSGIDELAFLTGRTRRLDLQRSGQRHGIPTSVDALGPGYGQHTAFSDWGGEWRSGPISDYSPASFEYWSDSDQSQFFGSEGPMSRRNSDNHHNQRPFAPSPPPPPVAQPTYPQQIALEPWDGE